MNQQKNNSRERNPDLHKGHRQRLKDKVRLAGLSCLSTHEVLELMLTYVLPRKDVNELSHTLLATFGSIKNILEAPRSELEKIKGIGKEASLYLTILPDILKLYSDDKKVEPIDLKHPTNCHKFFMENIGMKEVEQAYLIFVDEKYKFKKCFLLAEGDFHKVNIKKDETTNLINNGGTSQFILIHTHPNGTIEPSYEDIKATKSMLTISTILQKNMLDHIIINDCEYYSFKQSGDLEGYSREARKNFSILMGSL